MVINILLTNRTCALFTRASSYILTNSEHETFLAVQVQDQIRVLAVTGILLVSPFLNHLKNGFSPEYVRMVRNRFARRRKL